MSIATGAMCLKGKVGSIRTADRIAASDAGHTTDDARHSGYVDADVFRPAYTDFLRGRTGKALTLRIGSRLSEREPVHGKVKMGGVCGLGGKAKRSRPPA